MLYVMLALLVGFLVGIFNEDADDGCCAGIVTLVVGMIFFGMMGTVGIGMTQSTNVYKLAEHNGRYYETSMDGTKVTITIDNGNGKRVETYKKSMVVFCESDNPSVTITSLERAGEGWEFWLFWAKKGNESVVISVPKSNNNNVTDHKCGHIDKPCNCNTNETPNTEENLTENESTVSYCTNCGKELLADWLFCGGCGNQLPKNSLR